MSIRRLSVEATPPESLPLLKTRLLVAEKETQELLRDVGGVGVSREQHQPIQRVLGAEGAELLVARVCRLESLLHTLRLTVFRLDTERALNPTHAVCLEVELESLQQQLEEEQLSSQKKLVCLRDQLFEALQETHTLRHQLELTHCSQMDAALATEELKMLKVQMSQKLEQMRAELAEEEVARLEAQQSHNALLQRVEEMEELVDREREQVKLLQEDCHALRADGQEARAELREKEELVERLRKEYEQLKGQKEEKDTRAEDLSSELKGVRLALQKQQEENSQLISEKEQLKETADKVQGVNEKLEVQCCDLSSALRSLTAENTRLQTSLKGEQERVVECVKEQELQLETVNRNIQSDLQEALTHQLLLSTQLDTLRADHAKLQLSSASALEAAVNHQDLLDRTIQRLRVELNSALQERESLQRDLDQAKTEMSVTVSKLEKERDSVEARLSELQVEVCELSSALQKREEQNRGLMGRLTALHDHQMFRELMDSRNKLTYEKNKLQEAVVCGASDADQLDNRKLCVETDLLPTKSTQQTLQHHREAELHQAREEIGRLTEQVNALRREKHHGKKTAQRELTELKKALDETSTRSGDLSRANQELREKVCELEKLASNQKSRIKAQKVQIKQHLENRVTLTNSQKMKELEAEMRSLEMSKNTYEKKCYEQSQSLLQICCEMAALQAEIHNLSSNQEAELQSERHLTHKLQDKCKMLEECVLRLREERDEMEVKMKDVHQESQQISENLQEAHGWFRSRFHSLNSEAEHNYLEPKENVLDSPTPDTGQHPPGNSSVMVCVAEPEVERWTSTLQRWELTGGYNQTRRAQSLT